MIKTIHLLVKRTRFHARSDLIAQRIYDFHRLRYDSTHIRVNFHFDVIGIFNAASRYPMSDTVRWFSIPRSLQQLNPHSIRIFRERVPEIAKLARLDRELDSFAMERRRRFVYLRDL